MKNQENSRLGLRSMVLLGINGMIGSGIFLLPGTVTSLAGSWSIFVYLFVMVIVMSIAWCFAQCAALFNRNGGAYIYAKAAFGEFIGFEIGIMRWAVGIIAWASLVVAFITALSCAWPSVLEEPYRSCFILIIVGGLGFLNIVGVKFFKYINNLVSIAKIIPLLFFVIIGMFCIDTIDFTPIKFEELKGESFGAAALVIFYAFSGFEILTVAAGEMKNPQRNIPLAIMLVITFVSVLYLVIQFISMGILGGELSQSQTPFADAAQRMLGDKGKLFVTLAMLISIGGINLSASFITPRSGAALAEDGMIPRKIAEKGRFETPTLAILVTVGATVVLAISGSFTHLVVVSVISRFVQYIATCLAAVVLHRRINQSQKTSQKLLFVTIPLIALLGIGWLILQATPMQLMWGLSAPVLGIPLYFFQRKFQDLSKCRTTDLVGVARN